MMCLLKIINSDSISTGTIPYQEETDERAEMDFHGGNTYGSLLNTQEVPTYHDYTTEVEVCYLQETSLGHQAW